MIRAIVFDLDDTLYPEIEFVFSGYRAVSEEVRRQFGFHVCDELVALFQSGARGDLFTPVLQRHFDSLTEDYIKKLVQVYREHLPQINPFPETQNVLDVLRPCYSLGLISDGILGVQERKLEALGLRPYFDAIIFTDQWGREFWKPHARCFKECARLLDVDLESLVLIGDNPNKDFVTARRLGIRTIRVRRGGTLHHALRLSPEFEAEIEIADLAAIPGLLREMDA